MTDNPFDQWIASIAQNADSDQLQHEMIQRTVINLSNPQVGDVFTFMPNEFWEVARVMPLHGDLMVNRAVLLLRNTADDYLYSVPQRLNGNLERRTLQIVPQAFIRYLRFGIDPTSHDPAELHYIIALADVPAYVEWSSKHQGWTMDFEASTDPSADDDRVARLQWAVGVMGGLARGPFMFVRYEEAQQSKSRTQSMNLFVTLDVLDVTAEPDATLLEHVPPQTDTVVIDPTDLQGTAKTLVEHFDVDELMEVLRRLG